MSDPRSDLTGKGLGADPFAAAAESAVRLAEATGVPRHDAAVVLGSGWAPAAGAIGRSRPPVPVDQLGAFPEPRVPGHPGTVVSTEFEGLEVLVLVGRVHAYEGHTLQAVVHGVRTAVAAGCTTVVLTNAAGAVNPSYGVGQQVLIGDHLNLTGGSPLWGASSFLDLGDLYSARLRAAIVEAVPGLAEGVYAGVSGPQYETPAEIRMLRLLGADLVGMSTVHEAIAARHAGAEVVALSLVTNAAAGTAEGPLHHEEIIAAAGAATSRMAETVTTILRVVGA